MLNFVGLQLDSSHWILDINPIPVVGVGSLEALRNPLEISISCHGWIKSMRNSLWIEERLLISIRTVTTQFAWVCVQCQ